MRIEQLGRGDPMLAVVGGIHGDEPCGVRAIEQLLEEAPSVERPVKFIIANECALEQNERYIDTDMNRVFPGTRGSEVHERRLAYDLLLELAGCTTLSMHSTQSYRHPFAIVNRVGPLAAGICPQLSVEALLEVNHAIPHSLVEYATVLEIECGLQGTEQATANAVDIVREFLTATGALSTRSATETRSVPTYRLREQIPKQAGESYAVHVENFEPVLDGTPYATIDDQPVTADRSFYPVLMSAYGYENQFGYAAELTGALG